MKKIGLLFFVLPFVFYGQNSEKELKAIVKAEKKSAAKKMALVTNPNTYNYDIVYHRYDLKLIQQFNL